MRQIGAKNLHSSDLWPIHHQALGLAGGNLKSVFEVNPKPVGRFLVRLDLHPPGPIPNRPEWKLPKVRDELAQHFARSLAAI